MKKFLISLLIVLLCTAVYPQSELSYNKRLKKLYNNTPTKDSVYKLIKNELDFIKITKNDTIADIGSEDGYYPALYSIFSDSVMFYLNDIERKDFYYFDSLISICSKIKNHQISNSFIIVVGNDSCTKLPMHFFNKVIIRQSFHHFINKSKMLDDIKKIMKPGAKLILYEQMKTGESQDNDLCSNAMTREALLSVLNKAGFKLTNESAVENSRYWLEFELK